MRFLLALWVIVNHLVGRAQMLDPWMTSLPLPAQKLVRGGYLAVGTFFVLSGFVMARSYGTKDWSSGELLRYAVARVCRIYPAYLLSMLIIAPWIYEFLTHEGTRLWKAGMLANYGLLLQGWFGNTGVSWNTPAWSLTCEFFFYLCFPFAVRFLRCKTWTRLALLTLAAIFFPTLLRRCHVPEAWQPLYHFADFAIGIAAADAYSLLKRTQVRGVYLYAPAALLYMALVALPALLCNALTLSDALRPLNAFLLVGFALGGGFLAKALSHPAMLFLGHSSYAMYILHVPLLWWYRRFCFDENNIITHNQAALLFILLVIAVSAITFRYFEEPLNRAARRLADKRLRFT